MKQEHMFLFNMSEHRLGIAFCKTDEYDKQQAKEEVSKALRKHYEAAPLKLNYLGSVNYEEMDEGIKDQLRYFVKYDPVWLVI